MSPALEDPHSYNVGPVKNPTWVWLIYWVTETQGKKLSERRKKGFFFFVVEKRLKFLMGMT